LFDEVVELSSGSHHLCRRQPARATIRRRQDETPPWGASRIGDRVEAAT
jgi:hypothetical protein